MTSCLPIIGQAKVTPGESIFKMTHQGYVVASVSLWCVCLAADLLEKLQLTYL